MTLRPMDTAPKTEKLYRSGPVITLDVTLPFPWLNPPRRAAQWMQCWGHGGTGYWKLLDGGSIAPDHPGLNGWLPLEAEQ